MLPDKEINISFRVMTAADFPRMTGWLNDPEVRQWYGKKSWTPESASAYLKPKIDEVPRRTYSYIIQLGRADAGYIQTYLLSSYENYDKYIQSEEGTAGIDLFLAPDYMHKGHGSRIIKKFMQTYIFSGKLFSADKCTVGPEPKNISAIRMYEKAGFKWIKTVDIPDEDEPEYIMIIRKEVIC